MDIAAFLRTINAFQGLTEDSAEQLARRSQTRAYQAGTPIIRKGEPGDSMFVIYRGSVHVPLLDSEGEQAFLARLEERQFFGEMALLTGEPRNADVIAETDCECLIIPKSAVIGLIKAYPEVGRFLTNLLGHRLMSVGGLRQVGKYQLTRELGRGGMAVVYEGIHPTLERPVAIKMLAHELVYHEQFAERFRNEAKIIAHLHHPNIVEVHDAEEAYATFFIVMEKVNGFDLDHCINRGQIPTSLVRKILTQVASALGYAHERGIVHRDVKPSNILINKEGDAKLTDFGLALVNKFEQNLAISPEFSIGTPTHMAPEQAMGLSVDGRADIYALGIVAYEMLTRQPPFTGRSARDIMLKHATAPFPSPQKLNPQIPDDLESFVMRATQKKPEDRFQNCQEIVDALNRASNVSQSLDTLKVETLTFVFAPERSEEVKQIIDDLRARVGNLQGIRMS